MFKKVARKVVHAFADSRRFYYKRLEQIAKGKKNLTILELGSGYKVRGRDYYSAKHLFDSSNQFIQSDINPDFGHKVIDVTSMNYSNEYDIILCLNVLEHVYDFNKAINNIHKALKENGTIIIAVPVFYPLHDEPYDYWRFTEHAIRKLLDKKFSGVTIEHTGKREFAYGYFVTATKKK